MVFSGVTWIHFFLSMYLKILWWKKWYSILIIKQCINNKSIYVNIKYFKISKKTSNYCYHCYPYSLLQQAKLKVKLLKHYLNHRQKNNIDSCIMFKKNCLPFCCTVGVILVIVMGALKMNSIIYYCKYYDKILRRDSLSACISIFNFKLKLLFRFILLLILQQIQFNFFWKHCILK